MEITNARAESLSVDEVYRLLIGLIVPRPIAWVTSLSLEGVVNLAPFSAFTYLWAEPPLIGISVMRRGDELKDTARNIAARADFVVNIADETLIEPVRLSAAEHSVDVSEVELLGLSLVPSLDVVTPRLECVPAALECGLDQVIPFGGRGAQLIVGRVRRFHVRGDLLDGGKVVAERLRPLCRIAGPKYAGLGEVRTLAPVRRDGSHSYST
ncbi:flavin reductase family protein [Bosea sp. (in: a-proteobacteria)]|uniref:flavin reductase family protein n=1 Tax=Bosea sp. (in: a-proteobacteria) TaxID=1871050 RepID=UPI002DDD11A2|nr:flavin reductase family protein [Bosea sp. (in: a-proteobacteria)]HEV2512076.1 flavin reductase family protein [Bosea sp. (in: a-proteobacteria)]